MSDDTVDPARAVHVRLRARLAVVERAAWFGLVHALRGHRRAPSPSSNDDASVRNRTASSRGTDGPVAFETSDVTVAGVASMCPRAGGASPM